jgi:hypothetical protein
MSGGTRLPPIYTLLRAGKDGPTQGLARGMVVEDAGGPLLAPVGHAILGRMFDVFGNAIDCEPVPSGLQWRSVHQAPPPLAMRSTKSEVFETGIKIIEGQALEDRTEEKLRDGEGHEHRDHILTVAVTLLHVAIAIVTIAIIVRGRRWPWYASLALAVR